MNKYPQILTNLAQSLKHTNDKHNSHPNLNKIRTKPLTQHTSLFLSENPLDRTLTLLTNPDLNKVKTQVNKNHKPQTQRHAHNYIGRISKPKPKT